MIRPMRPDDLSRVSAIAARAFGAPRPPPDPEGAYTLALFDPDRGAYAHGTVIAGEAELHEIAVEPGRRRSGVGRAMLAAFLEAARARGAEHAHLEVAEDNVAAIALYRVAGFTEVGRRRRYYPSGADAVLMRASS